MVIVPIIIYRDRKSDKEIHEEMERDRKWRELMEKEEAAERARIEEAKQKKLREKRERIEAFRKLIYDAEQKNPWEFRVLPGGWNLFGQLSAEPIPWDGTEEEYKNLTENKK